MEGQRTTITQNHGKKKILPLNSLSIGVDGGIAGILVFGGALAIAGFMAVSSFATNKQRTKRTQDHHPNPKPQQLLDELVGKSEEDHGTTQRLSSLQHSTVKHGDAKCCWTSNMSINQVNSHELPSAQPMILEEKTDLKSSSVEEIPTHFHHQEIVFSDHSHPESAASSNGSGVAEECLVSLFNNSSYQAQVEKDEPHDGLTSSETESETEDDDINEDDGDDDMMSNDVSEIGEKDSSKATGITSLDYSEEPVWPAELIQEPKQKFKGDYSASHVCSDSDVDGSDNVGNEDMTVAQEATSNKNVNFSMVLNDQLSVLRTWAIPIMLLSLLLLLVLLNRRPQESLHTLDDVNSVIVDSME